jgi:CheY-like chemotaxis protein
MAMPAGRVSKVAPRGATPIAIVDDEPDDVFFLQQQLRRIGVSCRVATFYDGHDAMSRWRQLAAKPNSAALPELLFLDINMPGPTGFSVLCWLREQEWMKNLKVVMLSGSGDPGDVALATTLTADAYAAKHPSPSQLEKIIARLAPHLLPRSRAHLLARDPPIPKPPEEPTGTGRFRVA